MNKQLLDMYIKVQKQYSFYKGMLVGALIIAVPFLIFLLNAIMETTN